MHGFLAPLFALGLGVNIDHIATLRNARGTPYPDPIQAALAAEEAGADVITLHLREDRRHIKDEDVARLRPLLRTRMNLECAITPEMLRIACAIRPQDVCLVPERREELTTEGGLDVERHFDATQAACTMLAQEGIRVALFVDANPHAITAAKAAGASIIELHTGLYANLLEQTLMHSLEDSSQRPYDPLCYKSFHADQCAAGLKTPAVQQELIRLQEAVALGLSLGLQVHAGHGLHYGNVQPIASIPGIRELNIGHAIVSHAVLVGWMEAVRSMKALLSAGIESSPLETQ